MRDELSAPRRSSPRPSSFILQHLPFTLTLAVFFALALPNLNLPGLHNDEAVEAGLQAMQILSGQPITAFREAGLSLGGRTFPLMVQDYIGAFNVYFVLPFFAVFGSSVEALRLYTLCIGAAALALVYGFLARAVSKRAGLVAATLLAASPSFIFWQRQGVLVASLTIPLTVAVLWAGTAYTRRGGWRLAALLGLLCGAGLYAKLLFIWIIGGALGAFVLVNPKFIIQNPKSKIPNLKSQLPSALAFGLAFLLALTPLFIYNLQTGGTFLSVGANLATSYYGVNNLDFFTNFAARLDHFRAVLGGRDHLWYLGGSFGNGMWESTLALSAFVILGRWLFRRQRARLPAALLWVLALGLVQSSFTVSGLFPTHLALFTPLPPILVALAAETLLDPFHEPIFIHLTGPNLSGVLGGWVSGWLGFLNTGMIIVWFGLASLFARDVFVTIQYHGVLAQTGGFGAHSDAVYRLADYLNDQQYDCCRKTAPGPLTVYALDWGFGPQVRLLTGDGVQPQEIFGYTWEADEGFKDRLALALDQPGAYFVFHTPQETIFPRREQFDSLVAELGREAVTVAAFSRRDGAPVFEVIQIK